MFRGFHSDQVVNHLKLESMILTGLPWPRGCSYLRCVPLASLENHLPNHQIIRKSSGNIWSYDTIRPFLYPVFGQVESRLDHRWHQIVQGAAPQARSREKKYEEKWTEAKKQKKLKNFVDETMGLGLVLVLSYRCVMLNRIVSARYNHMDMAHLEEILKECVAKGTRQRMIVTDGVIHSVGMHENLWFAHVSRVLDDPPSSNVIQNDMLHVFFWACMPSGLFHGRRYRTATQSSWTWQGWGCLKAKETKGKVISALRVPERCKSFAFLTEAKFATLRTSTRHKSLWTSARALGKHFTGQNSSVNWSFYSILTEWKKGRIETSWIVTFCRSCFHYPRGCFRCESFPQSRICCVTTVLPLRPCHRLSRCRPHLVQTKIIDLVLRTSIPWRLSFIIKFDFLLLHFE